LLYLSIWLEDPYTFPKTKHTIGIDITTGSINVSIESKWNPSRRGAKGYQHYVDNLIVIVVSDSFGEKKYQSWNKDTPKNILILRWTDLDRFFGIKLSFDDRRRLYLLSRCNWRNKEEMVKRWKQSQTIKKRKKLKRKTINLNEGK
jgi:hypothetical protein